MVFAKALTTLPKDSRQKIADCLSVFGGSTALCYRARACLQCESRLPLEAWKSLFESLLAAGVGNPKTIQEAMVRAWRDWILKGPLVNAAGVYKFGRAVTLEYFCRLLVEEGYFPSVLIAKRNIKNLLMRPAEVVASRWRTLLMGRYLMWATFQAGKTTDPFEELTGTADEIRGLLGLDRNEKGLPLLLLVYTLGDRQAPRFPTVADAYAGDRWNYFFTPAPAGASSGMTLPWPEYEDRAPRPEVVHAVITGSQIISPLRLIL
jgi:hypothetical protein